jgi:hypothetical protein
MNGDAMNKLNRNEYTCEICENYKCECRCAVQPGVARESCGDCGPVPCFAHQNVDCTCTKIIALSETNDERRQ